MIAIVWEFIVRDEALSSFRAMYGPDGDWARMFGRHPGYLGTTLLQDTASAARFLTIDRWQSEDHFRHMQREERLEYSRLDRRCEEMIIGERQVGVFDES